MKSWAVVGSLFRRVPRAWEYLFRVKRPETWREQARRDWVTREQLWRDEEEEFDRAKASAATQEERQRIMDTFAHKRKGHRLEDVAAGRRELEGGIRMRQIMWARWLEAAVANEMEARDAFRELQTRNHSDPLLREFRASLVCIGAVASAFEALYGDIKYLIPLQRPRDRRHQLVSQALTLAFGLPGPPGQHLAVELRWLFELRDFGFHPYTEAQVPAQHPAGPNTGTEHVDFNALTSGRAVDALMTALAFAESPPQAINPWIQRWSVDRSRHFQTVVHFVQTRREAKPL